MTFKLKYIYYVSLIDRIIGINIDTKMSMLPKKISIFFGDM